MWFLQQRVACRLAMDLLVISAAIGCGGCVAACRQLILCIRADPVACIRAVPCSVLCGAEQNHGEPGCLAGVAAGKSGGVPAPDTAATASAAEGMA